MVDLVKITELPLLASVPTDAVFPVVHDGVTYKATRAALQGAAGANGSAGANGTNGTNGSAGVDGSLATIGRLSRAGSLGLWHFNGSLADSSGNGKDFTADTGTAVYCDIWPGFRGIDLAGALRLIQSDTSFKLLGDMTFELIGMLNGAHVGNPLFAFGGPGETQAENTAYEVSLSAARAPTWFSEHTAGVNVSYAPSAVALPPEGVPFHLAATRISNVVQFYLNGVALGAASSALTAPDGATTAALRLGGYATGLAGAFLCGGFQLFSSGLSGAEILADSDASIGALY